MNVELNYAPAQEKTFETVEEAQEFAKTLNGGFDIWVNGELYQSVVKDFKTGTIEETFYS